MDASHTPVLNIAEVELQPRPPAFAGKGQVGEFRADPSIEERLVVEVKAVPQLSTPHETRLINYLETTGIQVGLLLDFGRRPPFKRRVFGPDMAHPRPSAFIRVKRDHV